ncbi:hypothetical protein BDY24DRAFT_398816 [Mrakia frigida]|uniref:uncharacterized protein n=1 Tax=Mrakia frigida TaxID=29902 RepID=UPI003FCC0E0F
MSPLSPNGTGSNIVVNHLTSHPDLLQVHQIPGTDQSHVEVLKSFKRGDKLAALEGLSTGATKAYSSVQISSDSHIELNSSFLFVNHSCDPNVAFKISSCWPASEWKVEALKDLAVGDTLTFFYPSTEWDMDRGFECRCQEKTCLKSIKGAKYIDRSTLKQQGYVSPHIWKLKEEQEAESK